MKSPAAACLGLMLLVAPALARPALAANADAPHGNVDRSNDAGNSTGDDKVDALNRGQLDENQKPATAQPAPDPATAAPAAPTAPR